MGAQGFENLLLQLAEMSWHGMKNKAKTNQIEAFRFVGRLGHYSLRHLRGNIEVRKAARGRFHSPRSNTTRGQIDFGTDDEHFKMTAK